MRAFVLFMGLYGFVIAAIGVAAEVYYRRNVRNPYRPTPIRWPARPVSDRPFTLKDSRWT